jgi:hypothetical protein
MWSLLRKDAIPPWFICQVNEQTGNLLAQALNVSNEPFDVIDVCATLDLPGSPATDERPSKVVAISKRNYALC